MHTPDKPGQQTDSRGFGGATPANERSSASKMFMSSSWCVKGVKTRSRVFGSCSCSFFSAFYIEKTIILIGSCVHSSMIFTICS